MTFWMKQQEPLFHVELKMVGQVQLNEVIYRCQYEKLDLARIQYMVDVV